MILNKRPNLNTLSLPVLAHLCDCYTRRSGGASFRLAGACVSSSFENGVYTYELARRYFFGVDSQVRVWSLTPLDLLYLQETVPFSPVRHIDTRLLSDLSTRHLSRGLATISLAKFKVFTEAISHSKCLDEAQSRAL